VLARRDELAGKTVVTYCTGGIRCEKAALFMADAGIEHVLQLDGGILAYLEHAGGRHFEGGCFVFDQRETLDATHLAGFSWKPTQGGMGYIGSGRVRGVG
jgi:UPF0176 protein